jgi:hypothetical protein
MTSLTYSEKLEAEIKRLNSEIDRLRDVLFFTAIFAAMATTILACVVACQFV